VALWLTLIQLPRTPQALKEKLTGRKMWISFLSTTNARNVFSPINIARGTL